MGNLSPKITAQYVLLVPRVYIYIYIYIYIYDFLSFRIVGNSAIPFYLKMFRHSDVPPEGVTVRKCFFFFLFLNFATSL